MPFSDIPLPNRVEDYRFGHFLFGDTTYKHDVVIWGGVVRPWQRQKGHQVTPADLEPMLDPPPAILVIGTGVFGLMRVTEETRIYLAERGVQAIEARTRAAVDTFNRLLDVGEDAALAMHLTC